MTFCMDGHGLSNEAPTKEDKFNAVAISNLFYSRRHFNSCVLVIRQNTLVIMVGSVGANVLLRWYIIILLFKVTQ